MDGSSPTDELQAWLSQPGHHFLTADDPRYPRALLAIGETAPLFALGDPEVLQQRQLAIVGSRHPTPAGLDNTRDFAAELASRGLVITSGLALGVDGAAHEAALAAGGLTVAVCGTGLDRVYPARHRDLARRIAEHGVLISEFPPGTPPLPGHFPRRNRLISGLSMGVLVVEAALNSGSLITARTATGQGREVFAIPGSIHNPLARGCHRLIRDGAKLVESVDDILEEIAPQLGMFSPLARHSAATPEDAPTIECGHRQLLTAIGFEPARVDTLVERTGLTAEAVSSMLLILELRGLVAQAPGGAYMQVITR
jgi:DNA processing protein